MPTNCLSVFAHFVGLALKGLRKMKKNLQCEQQLSEAPASFRSIEMHVYFYLRFTSLHSFFFSRKKLRSYDMLTKNPPEHLTTP